MPSYGQRTEELLALLPTITESEYAELAVACADQAGLSADGQARLRGELATCSSQQSVIDELATQIAIWRSARASLPMWSARARTPEMDAAWKRIVAISQAVRS